jgi:NAD(P)-dependent dehydrogenase (short-subunit alcohol dehydrogenase family)
MKGEGSSSSSILITGGTSGLGFELVRLYAGKGYDVITTGRRNNIPAEFNDRVHLKKVDFSSLALVSKTAKEICKYNDIAIVINNAGIFSSPDLILTEDNLEYTFQVNFLSHLLINEIIIRNRNKEHSLLVAVVTSPVYKTAESALKPGVSGKPYRRFKTYSESKFFLALMCKYLSEVCKGSGVKIIGFDPGVFSSDIFRLQGRLMRQLYRIAAPFMRDPSSVASALGVITGREDTVSGSVYDRQGREFQVPLKDETQMKSFWIQCNALIEKYL